MEFAGTARSWLLSFTLMFLASLALANLIYNLPAIQSQAGLDAGAGMGLPSPLPSIRLPVEISLIASLVTSVAATGLILAVYLKYRPRSGRIPLEEFIPILVIILLVFSMAFLLSPQQSVPVTDQGENGGIPGGDGNGEGGEGSPLPSITLLFVGPGLVGLLLAAIAFSTALLLFSVVKGRRGVETYDFSKEEARDQAIESLGKTIYHLGLGDDIRSVVLRCYRDLVRLFQDHGLDIKPNQTARELEHEALLRLGISDNSSRSLRALFEVARYSNHAITDADREWALEALLRAKAELEG